MKFWPVGATHLEELHLQCKVLGRRDSIFTMAPFGLSHRYRFADCAVAYALVWVADWRAFLERLALPAAGAGRI